MTRDFSIRPESSKAPGVLLARAERSCSSSRFGECGDEGLCPEAFVLKHPKGVVPLPRKEKRKLSAYIQLKRKIEMMVVFKTMAEDSRWKELISESEFLQEHVLS